MPSLMKEKGARGGGGFSCQCRKELLLCCAAAYRKLFLLFADPTERAGGSWEGAFVPNRMKS